MSGDDITRDCHGPKYMWLIYVKQRTKWTPSKLKDIEGSSSPFGIVGKKSIVSKMMNSNFLNCQIKKHFQ